VADGEWKQWIEEHGAAALLYARQISSGVEDAEDAVNEGFLKFWARRSGARDAVGLFFACVRSAALDGRRRATRRQRREEGSRAGRAMFAEGGDAELARREEVEALLALLPEEQREVLVLKIWGGLTFVQIGEALGESANTVAGRYRYALLKMAGPIQKEVGHER
jgi:RNA polymerase sigma-70 factor (ECF subfamily)